MSDCLALISPDILHHHLKGKVMTRDQSLAGYGIVSNKEALSFLLIVGSHSDLDNLIIIIGKLNYDRKWCQL